MKLKRRIPEFSGWIISWLAHGLSRMTVHGWDMLRTRDPEELEARLTEILQEVIERGGPEERF